MRTLKLYCILVSVLWAAGAQASVDATSLSGSKDAIKVAYFGLESPQDFEQKIKPVFYQNLRHCNRCELVNHTPYEKDGSIDKTAFVDAVEELPNQVKMIFVNFNEVLNKENQEFRAELLKKANEGVLLVGAAGAPIEGSPSAPLHRTLLGSMNKIAIVGDMGARDRLYPASAFYGPELLLAVRPPKDLLEKGLGPVIFSARWASELKEAAQKDWYNYFSEVKVRSRKLWMDVSDFF